MNRKQYQIYLTVNLTGSDELAVSNDILKVQDVYRHIQERPGRDHFEILVANGEWQALLTPKDNTMHYSDTLHQKLEVALQGLGNVEVMQVER